MLHREASNAYAWWWASHIRTKQSKWLENDLHDMENRVESMMKLIEQDADSFAKKAELYFRRRPELTYLVEEMYKAYKALADRHDRMSGELHKANHTIAIAFPDQVEFAMQDDEDDNPPKAITSVDLSKLDKPMEIPQFSLIIKNKEDYSAPKKLRHRRISSQFNKEKAQEELDRLQKKILVRQTEKEFTKSTYENTLAQYWDIERQITEMQEEFCGLQDACGANKFVEDAEDRSLVVATAIKSCEDRLVSLQEQQKITAEEARIELDKVQDAKRKLKVLKGESGESETDTPETSDQNIELNSTSVNTEDGVLEKKRLELQSMCLKLKEHFDMSSETSAMELAEKVDELVDKVTSLELTVSSKNIQIKRLRSETDQHQKHLWRLEEDKAILLVDSNSLTEKLKEAEDELQRIQHLEKCLQDDEGIFQTQFIEACHSLNNLSKNLHLQSPKHREHILSQEGGSFGSSKVSMGESKEENHVKIQNAMGNLSRKESYGRITNESGKLMGDAKQESEVPQEHSLQINDDFHVGELHTRLEETGDIPNLQNSLLHGLERRQNVFLAEYTSILHNYNDTRQRLLEIEKKNQEYHSETMVQVKELKNDNAVKVEEIRLLKEILNSLRACLNVNAPKSMEQPGYQVAKNQTEENETFGAAETGSPDAEDIKLCHVNDKPTSSALEGKFREEIDMLLEENLDFWLRYCTSYNRIQEFQAAYEDLKSDTEKLNEIKNQEGDAIAADKAALQEPLPIYKSLRELKNELHVWLEKTSLLSGELKCRFSSLCSIQDEVSRVSKASETEDNNFTPYQAAKFQGEVLGMKLQNNKVANDLQDGLNFVRGLQVEVSKTLEKLNENLNLPQPRNYQQHNYIRRLSIKTRIPLRTFLFGAKPKKPSIFSCVNPALQKQYSDLRSSFPR